MQEPICRPEGPFFCWGATTLALTCSTHQETQQNRALFRASRTTDPAARWRVPRWTSASPRSGPTVRSRKQTEQTVGIGRPVTLTTTTPYFKLLDDQQSFRMIKVLSQDPENRVSSLQQFVDRYGKGPFLEPYNITMFIGTNPLTSNTTALRDSIFHRP